MEEEKIYKQVPNKYIYSFELYNKLILYEYYVNFTFRYSVIDSLRCDD